MAPKKKQPKNPFYFFMLDFKEREEKKGRRFTGGMKEVAECAGPVWNDMTSELKEHYCGLAAQMKKKENEDLTKKFTSLGVSYADLDAESREQEEAYQIMVDTVRAMVRSLNRDTTLRSESFFLCHVNYYYKTEKGNYFPAELGMAEFTLQNGLVDTLHFYVNPGKVELGFRFEALDWSQKTHNLPVDDPDWTLGEKNFFTIFEAVSSFFKTGGRRPYPPVFTMPDSLNNNTSISAVKSLFLRLAEAADIDPSVFRIFPLPYLFFELRNHSVDEEEAQASAEYKYLPTVALAENEMEKDVFTYAKNIGCEFHEEHDLGTFCSLSIVTRWVFTICDHCCRHLSGMEMILGRHCPFDADINRELVPVPNTRRSGSCRGALSWRQQQRTSPPQESRSRSSRDKKAEHSFMPTIIDHGKLREEGMAQASTSQGSSHYSMPADVRLPRNAATSYSGATIRHSVTYHQPPLFSARDFPEMGAVGGRCPAPSFVEPRLKFGRGRGVLRQPSPDKPQVPSWPVSGRGYRPK